MQTVTLGRKSYVCGGCFPEAHDSANFFVREKCDMCERWRTCVVIVGAVLNEDKPFEAVLLVVKRSK